MEIKHLSTTLIQNWPLCPARAMAGYDVRNEYGDDIEGTEPTRFGSVVHDVAERFHQTHMQGGVLPDPIELFDSAWQQSKAYDFDYYSLGRNKIADFLERTIHQRRGDTVMVELDFVYDLVNNEIYLINELSASRKDIVAAIIEGGGVPVASKIDRVDRVDDTTFEIFDYKTNAIAFTRFEVENSLQLGIYDIVIRALYPEAVDVVCVYDMVRHGRFSTDFDAQQRENLRHYLINLWHQIQNEEKPEEKINTYCTWCDLKLACTKYQAALRDDPVLADLEGGSDEQLLALHNQYEDYKAKIKILTDESDKIKDLLGAKIIKDNLGEPIQLGDKEIYLQPNGWSEYSIKDLYPIFQKRRALVLLKEIASVSKMAVDRLLKQRPELKDEVEPLLKKSFKASSLKVRKVKQNRVEAVYDEVS